MNLEITMKKPGIARINFFDNYGEFEQLKDKFSITQKNFAYIKRCKGLGARINPAKETIKKSVIKFNGEFELGLLFDVLKFCKDNFYNRTVNIKVDDEIKQYIKSNNFKLDTDVYVNDNGDKIRDYQEKSMQIALNKENGVFILGTGAGKTICCALLIHNLLKYNICKKILLICPFPDLANQTYKEISKSLQKYSYKITRFFQKFPFEKDSQVIICGSDILRSQFKELKKDLMEFDGVIVDEVHQIKSGNKISAVLKEFKTTKKYGFTGTLPSNDIDKWSLLGKIGPVRFNLPSVELRDNKFLTPVKVLGIKLNVDNIPTKIYDEEGNELPFTYQDEVEWLAENNQFNTQIAEITNKLKGNTLILINRLIHVETLKNLNFNKQVYIIQGEVPLDERDDIKKAMENNNDILVIAQVSTFSTGINVKNISNIVFPGTIGKSNIRIVQSIGRSLRLKEGKLMSTIIDIIPNTKYALRHWEERKKIYDSEVIPFKELNLRI